MAFNLFSVIIDFSWFQPPMVEMGSQYPVFMIFEPIKIRVLGTFFGFILWVLSIVLDLKNTQLGVGTFKGLGPCSFKLMHIEPI